VCNFDEEFTSEDPVLTPPKEPRPLTVEDQVQMQLLHLGILPLAMVRKRLLLREKVLLKLGESSTPK
jgi:hypothetical protein